MAATACLLGVGGWFGRARVADVLHELGGLRWGWVVAALGAESASMGSLARSHLVLLRVINPDVTKRSAFAVTYAGNAMSVSLPLVGSGVGTAFELQQWRRRGVDSAAVSWVLIVSGVASTLTFALMTAVGALVSGNQAALLVGLGGAAASALPALAVLLGVRIPRVRTWMVTAVAAVTRFCRRWVHRPKSDVAAQFAELLDRASLLRARPRQYLAASFLALRNWTADCLCLVCAIKASGAHVPWHGLLLAYCVAVTAASAAPTPGGIGFVEVALTAGLVAAGLPSSKAVVAVLVYRLISLFLVVAIGWLVAARIGRSGKQAQPPMPGPEPMPEPDKGPHGPADAQRRDPGWTPAASWLHGSGNR
ncbi:UPF0104 family protein [Streptacidiphilus sp. 4-A2]|nr:UPF0104 family protein [Streptacidiphilus sp. 4-A2]